MHVQTDLMNEIEENILGQMKSMLGISFKIMY